MLSSYEICRSCSHALAAHKPSDRTCMACAFSNGACAAAKPMQPAPQPRTLWTPSDSITDEMWREDYLARIEDGEEIEGISIRSGVALFIEADSQRIYNEKRLQRKLAEQAADAMLDLEPAEDRQRRATENLMRRISPQHVVSPLGKSLPTGSSSGDATGKAKPMKPIRKPSGVVTDEGRQSPDDERIHIAGLSLGEFQFYERNERFHRRDALVEAAKLADAGIFPPTWRINVKSKPSKTDIFAYVDGFTYDTLRNFAGLALEALRIYAWREAGDYAAVMRDIDNTASENKNRRKKAA